MRRSLSLIVGLGIVSSWTLGRLSLEHNLILNSFSNIERLIESITIPLIPVFLLSFLSVGLHTLLLFFASDFFTSLFFFFHEL
jgi:hypothetical protein